MIEEEERQVCLKVLNSLNLEYEIEYNIRPILYWNNYSIDSQRARIRKILDFIQDKVRGDIG